MTNPKFFISDIHLGARNIQNSKVQIQHLFNFFEHIAEQQGDLIIVGDLFDFWFEYKYVIPREYFHLLIKLQWLRDQKCQIYYVAGNHDFALGSFLNNDMGIHVYPDKLEMLIDGKQFFIYHGDGIVKKDIGYRIIKQIFRHPLSKFLFSFVHPDLGFYTAHFLSGLSRNHRPVKNRDKEYIDVAKTQFNRGMNYVIMGHTHKPMEHHEGDRIYINTGDWMENFTYAVYHKNHLQLKNWLSKTIRC